LVQEGRKQFSWPLAAEFTEEAPPGFEPGVADLQSWQRVTAGYKTLRNAQLRRWFRAASVVRWRTSSGTVLCP